MLCFNASIKSMTGPGLATGCGAAAILRPLTLSSIIANTQAVFIPILFRLETTIRHAINQPLGKFLPVLASRAPILPLELG